MTPDQFEELAGLGHARRLERGRVLVREGEQVGALYLLRSGQVKVSRAGPDGAAVIVALRGGPEVIGLLSVIDGGPASATVEVTEPVEAVVVTRRRFLDHLLAHPALMLEQMRRLAAVVRESDRHRVQQATLDLTPRVAGALLESAVPAEENGGMPSVALTQDELAGLVGATREAVARVLRRFREEGWIRTHRRLIELVDVAALVGVAGDRSLVV